MSALALAFKREGWKVTGSDVGFYPPISTYLKKNKVDYYPGWHPDRVLQNFSDGGKNDEIVVVGNVAGSTNPEWIYVQEHKLNYKSYPEIIKEFFIKKNSIVCAGTYGKSTSTTLLTWILKETGYDPSYMFGGLSLNDLSAAQMTTGDWSVVEGDEYKSSRWDTGPKFAYYSPTHLLLTSVIWDHADVYPTEKKYVNAFKDLLHLVPDDGTTIVSEQAFEALDMKKNQAITYGRGNGNDYRYDTIVQDKKGLTCTITHGDEKFEISTSCLGDYMADNIAGCFAMAHTIGIDPKKIITAIKSFKGMKRRLEKRADGRLIIFDDIAHSPVKARSILSTLKQVYHSNLVAVFEPNTGNRRPQAIPWYDHAFKDADEVIIPHVTKVKNNPDEEPPLEGDDLAAVIRGTHEHVSYINSDEKVVDYLQNQPKGTVVVFLGSHGFRGMIESLLAKL